MNVLLIAFLSLVFCNQCQLITTGEVYSICPMKKDYWLPADVLLLPVSMGLVKLKLTGVYLRRVISYCIIDQSQIYKGDFDSDYLNN
jgi:hypothetical protein